MNVDVLRRYRFPVFLILLLGFVLGSVLVSRASEVYRPTDSVRFFETDTHPVLANPGFVRVGPEGTLVVWDRTFQQFFYGNASDSAGTDTGSFRPDSVEFEELLNGLHRGRLLSDWQLTNEPEGFFDGEGTFWFYDPRLADVSDTFSVYSRHPTNRTSRVSGPVRSMVPAGDQVIVQSAADTSFVRRDPYSEDEVVDTASYSIEGRLVGFTPDGRYLTQSGGTLRSFEGGEQLDSRTFSSIRDVGVHRNGLYVLSGDGELVRLDRQLTAQYTFFLPVEHSYRSLAVRGDTLYVTARSGLYRAHLDESERSFFSQSSELDLERLARSLPSFERPEEVTPKLWTEAGGATTSMKVQFQGRTIRELRHDTSGFTSSRERPTDDLSTNPFQYFRVDSTYSDGEGTLYYYFPEERAVEQYDTSGRLVRRKKFRFKSVDNLRNVEFVGADDSKVLFAGDVMDRHRGFSRSLVVFDWEGDLRRVVQPAHPFRGRDYSTTGEVEWDYAGGRNLYEFHDGYVQVYDLKGYPRRTINDVYEPVDVARVGDDLFVLDLNGSRLRSFRVPPRSATRFGMPLDERTVHGAAARGNKTILSARSPGEKKLSLHEYNAESLEHEEVLRHPNQSLKHPFFGEGKGTVFFTGHRDGTNRITLYQSDTVKYSARPLAEVRNLRGPGFYESSRDLVFLPVEPRGDTGPAYRYLAPEGDTNAYLEDSRNLEELVPGGFAGFYGIENRGGTHAVVSGYLSRRTDTSPLRWTVADTLHRVREPIRNLTVDDDELFFVRSLREGYSELETIPSSRTSYRSGDSGAEEVEAYATFRGEVDLLNRRDGEFRLVLRTRPDGGQLLKWYRGGPPESGGIQGQVTVPNPADLEGIELRLSPSGQTVETGKTGRFSMSGVPAGYVQLTVPSYRRHFQYPVNLPVRPEEYTVRSSLPLVEQEELLLLESALKYFRRGRMERAGISLNAFRGLVSEGPYHEWTDGLAEEIYRSSGDTGAQFDLFEQRSRLYDPRERIELLRQLERPPHRRVLYGASRGLLETPLREFFRYRYRFLEKRTGDDSLDASSLLLPRIGEASGLPVLESNR